MPTSGLKPLTSFDVLLGKHVWAQSKRGPRAIHRELTHARTKVGDASSSWVEHACLARAAFLALALWACSPFFAAATYAFPGLTDSQTHTPPSSGPYAYQTFTPDHTGFLDLGESFVEPIFRTIITRVSDVYPSTGSAILYGINGLWNADSSLYMQNNKGGVDLIDPDTGAIVAAQIPYPFTTAAAVSFDPINPDVYYYTDGTRLMQYRVSTRSASVLKAFSAMLGGLGNSADWISANGRWFLLNIGGQIRVWDRLRNTLYRGSAPLTGIPPGWAGISPDGNYIILSLNPQHYSYKLDHTNKRVASQGVMFWDAAYDHGSVATASNGKTYFVTDGYRYEPNGVYRVDVTLNQAGKGYAQLTSNVYLFNRGYHQFGHFSCASRGVHQDWCFLSTESTDDQIENPGPWVPYKQEIIAVQVVPPFAVHRLAQHRSRPLDDQHYCRQPRVNANWEGTKVTFTSSFGSLGQSGCGYSDVYVIDVGQAP